MKMPTVASDTHPGKFYHVTKTSCTCPDFVYRQAKVGGMCKHMRKLYAPNLSKQPKLKESVIQFFKDGVSIVEAEEKYGVEKIDKLLELQLIIKVGRDKYYLM